MKNTNKMIISIVLIFCILTTGIVTIAADDFTGSAGASISWTYDKNAKVLNISGSGKMDNFDGTGGPWKDYAHEIETIIISEGITNIGSNAFSGCKIVENITIPNSVTSIGASVFVGCQNIVSITIPKTVTSINSNTFGQTKPVIYCSAGSEAAMLASTLELEVSEIKSGEVYTGSCGNTLTWSLNEASGVMTISGDGEMNNYPDSSSVPWQNYRTMIKVVNVDGKITHIGNNAFANLQNLVSIVLPSAVKTIGNNAFKNCVALKRISIPAEITSIGENAFDSCLTLAEINASELNGSFSSEEGVLFSKDKTKLITYPAAKTVEEYTVPDSVKSIAKGAFSYAVNLKKVNLGKGVSTIEKEAFLKAKALVEVVGGQNIGLIGEEAFRECSGLKKFNVGTVRKIEMNAFSYCNKLSEVSLGSVEEIGQRAFYLCSELPKINLPATVSVFDGSAFNGCSKLKEVSIDAANKHFTVEDGIVYNKDKTKLVYAPQGANKGTYVVKNSVTTIGKSAFYNTKATEITLPSNLKVIEDMAFYNAEELVKITIPDKVTEIGEYAFAYNKKAKNLKIGSSVKEIKKAAFSNCSLIESITIPDSVVKIGDYAFEHCKAAKSLKVGKKIAKIGIYAFYKCENIKPLKFSGSVEVGTFAFKGCLESK